MSPAGRAREQTAYVRGIYADASGFPLVTMAPAKQELLAIAPRAGSAGSSAPPDVATALGYDIAAALEEPDSR
jgi:hypothetical protein